MQLSLFDTFEETGWPSVVVDLVRHQTKEAALRRIILFFVVIAISWGVRTFLVTTSSEPAFVVDAIAVHHQLVADRTNIVDTLKAHSPSLTKLTSQLATLTSDTNKLHVHINTPSKEFNDRVKSEFNLDYQLIFDLKSYISDRTSMKISTLRNDVQAINANTKKLNALVLNLWP